MTTADPLELMISSGGAAGPRSLFVRIAFVNGGAEPVRLLGEFEPLPVFFSFRLVKADGTPLGLSGGGKIDFGPGRPRYLELAPGAKHTIDADAGTLLSDDLEPGRYSLSVEYHNQYGEDCFRGTLRSNAVSVEVPPS